MLMRILFAISSLGFCATSTAQNNARTLGNKSYEVSNHLGNVMVVVSDRKTPKLETTNSTLAFNETDIRAFNDYYPYGMVLENRNDNSDYKYGFQGQEKDDEVKGRNNSINYKYRVHDPRLGRFFAVDPLSEKYPHYSSYQFSGNKTINSIELEGLEEKPNFHVNRDELTTYSSINTFYGSQSQMINSMTSTSWGLDQTSYPSPNYNLFPEIKLEHKLESEVKGFLKNESFRKKSYRLPVFASGKTFLTLGASTKIGVSNEISLSNIHGFEKNLLKPTYNQELKLELIAFNDHGNSSGWSKSSIGISTSNFQNFKFYGGVGKYKGYINFSSNFIVESDEGYDANKAYFIASPFQTELGLSIEHSKYNSSTFGLKLSNRNLYSILRPTEQEVENYNSTSNYYNWFYNSEVYKDYKQNGF